MDRAGRQGLPLIRQILRRGAGARLYGGAGPVRLKRQDKDFRGRFGPVMRVGAMRQKTQKPGFPRRAGGSPGGGRPTVGLPRGAGGGTLGRPNAAQIQTQMQAAIGAYQAGNLADARARVGDVLLAAPETPDALHLDGLILLQQGALAAAVQRFAGAVGLAPDNGVYWANFGQGLRRQGKHGEALSALDKAIALAPRFAGGYLQRGLLYQELHRADEALGDYRSVIALAPDQPEGYARAVKLLLATRRLEEAVAVNIQALREMPDNGLFLSGAADGLERLSRLDEALVWAEKARAAMPDNPAAVKVWATIKRRQGDLDAARAALEAIDCAAVAPGTARLIHAELGQIYDRLGGAARAFDHFTQQNELARRGLAESAVRKETYLAQVAALRTAFTASGVGSWVRLEAKDIIAGDDEIRTWPPVFLVGFPRSGTTLLDQMLDAHNDVAVLEEIPVLLAVRDALAAKPGGYPGALATLSLDEVRELRQLYWRGLEALGDDGTKLMINKLPLNIIHAGLIQRVFPEARFLLSLRHPADVVLSCFMQDFQLNASMANFLSLEEAAHLYDQVMGLWAAYENLLPLAVHRIKYEDLIGDQAGHLRAVLDFLGLDWDAAVLDHVGHAQTRPAIMTPSYTQVTQPIYTRAADRWRRYDAYLAPVMARLAPYIADFGYDR